MGIATRPDIAGQVQRDLHVANECLSCSSVSVVRSGRDAVSRLHTMARSAGFLDMADIFTMVGMSGTVVNCFL